MKVEKYKDFYQYVTEVLLSLGDVRFIKELQLQTEAILPRTVWSKNFPTSISGDAIVKRALELYKEKVDKMITGEVRMLSYCEDPSNPDTWELCGDDDKYLSDELHYLMAHELEVDAHKKG